MLKTCILSEGSYLPNRPRYYSLAKLFVFSIRRWIAVGISACSWKGWHNLSTYSGWGFRILLKVSFFSPCFYFSFDTHSTCLWHITGCKPFIDQWAWNYLSENAETRFECFWQAILFFWWCFSLLRATFKLWFYRFR